MINQMNLPASGGSHGTLELVVHTPDGVLSDCTVVDVPLGAVADGGQLPMSESISNLTIRPADLTMVRMEESRLSPSAVGSATRGTAPWCVGLCLAVMTAGFAVGMTLTSKDAETGEHCQNSDYECPPVAKALTGLTIASAILTFCSFFYCARNIYREANE